MTRDDLNKLRKQLRKDKEAMWDELIDEFELSSKSLKWIYDVALEDCLMWTFCQLKKTYKISLPPLTEEEIKLAEDDID